MSLYTVHVPDAAPDAMTRGERTVLLREGFSLTAFVFGLLYLLWHRLWIAAAVWIVLLLALLAFATVIHPPQGALVALAGLMHLYLGIEGRDLLRSSLARRGYTMRDLVSASGMEAAEAQFFTRQPEAIRTAPPVVAGAARHMNAEAVPAVIGMFPDREGA